MVLPYRWNPIGTKTRKRPEVGDLFPHEHVVYVVTHVGEHPDKDADTGRLRWKLSYRPHDAPEAKERGGSFSGFSWTYYPDEHWPMCASCHEPQPCREQSSERVAAESSKRALRYSQAGVCPECQEAVTHRQGRRTYVENIEWPGGPAVTFHTRRKCFWGLMEYDKRWSLETGKPTTYTCGGHVTVHAGEYECTEGAVCPGPKAQHRSAQACDCCLSTQRRGIYPVPPVQRIMHEGLPTTRLHAR